MQQMAFKDLEEMLEFIPTSNIPDGFHNIPIDDIVSVVKDMYPEIDPRRIFHLAIYIRNIAVEKEIMRLSKLIEKLVGGDSPKYLHFLEESEETLSEGRKRYMNFNPTMLEREIIEKHFEKKE